jgi:uncharacterized protein (DUF488 family)
MLESPEVSDMRHLVSNHPHLFTVGHSAHSLDHFLQLLKSCSIDVVVDSRSYPYSDFAPHFDQQSLKKALADAGLQYLYLGRELGGRPSGAEYYDAKGHVFYDRVAASDLFQQGLSRLERGLPAHNVALLCAEEDPTNCHRRLLVARVLKSRGVEIDHIRGDGRLQSEREIEAAEIASHPQMPLFEEVSEWKSIPSVSRKNRQNSFSIS